MVPSDKKARKKWFKVMRREPLSEKSTRYCCEDHFDTTESVTCEPDFEEAQESEDPLIVPIDYQKSDMETKPTTNESAQAATAVSTSKSSQGTSSDNHLGNRECRCCLAKGQHLHTFGKAESKMLSENLNIYLITEQRLPQFICLSCLKFLYETRAFRNNVLAIESKLLRIIVEAPISSRHTAVVEREGKVVQSSHSDPLEIVPDSVEVKLEENSCDDAPEMSCADDEDGLLNTEPDVQALMSQVKTEDIDIHQDPLVHLPDQGRQSIKIEFEIFDSGGNATESLFTTPEKRTSKRKHKEEIQEAKKKRNSVSTYINIGDKPQQATNNTKIRANIILILQNSTVFPFGMKKANCFKCFYCEQTYGLFKDLKQHSQNSHKDGASDFTIFKELQAKTKKVIHADISCVKCKLCNETVATIDELVQHLINVHEKTYYSDIESDVKVPNHGFICYKLDKDILQCHLCETEFRFIKYLISHMVEHYGCFTCPTCDRKFVTFERYNEHCKTHVKTETKCTDCNLVFNTRRKMLDHRYLKHIKKKLNTVQCTECPLTFPISRPIIRFQHMEKEHGIKRPVYKCDMCSKTYQTIHGLGHHTRAAHVRKNEFMCDICGYVTTDKTIMSRHIDHHNGVRKFECDYCQKKFRTKGSLRLHFRGHFNDKRFACSLCDAAFIQKHCLKSHIKSRHPDSGVDLTQL